MIMKHHNRIFKKYIYNLKKYSEKAILSANPKYKYKIFVY